MNATSDWPKVTTEDARPSGKLDECFWCKAKVGEEHRRSCVTVVRKVRLRYIIEVDVKVPHIWTEEEILFHRNEGSWCANNAVAEIEAHCAVEPAAANGSASGCLCDRFKCEYVGEVDDTPLRSKD